MEPSLTEQSLFAPLIGRWTQHCGLSEDDRRAIEALPASRRTFDRDSYIVREGEEPTSCALLLSGFAFRQKLGGDGARQILSVHIPREFVDLQNQLLNVADHNVQALVRAEVAIVPRGALIDLAAARPAVGRAMWRDTLIDSSIFREWIVNVGQRSAKSRIAHLLCELTLRLEASGRGEAGVYKFPMTQEQIADATGLTAVHTNRTLQALRQDGLIALSPGVLTVLDWDRLCDLGDFSERYLHGTV